MRTATAGYRISGSQRLPPITFRVAFLFHSNRPRGRICTASIKVWWGAQIWHNSNPNLSVVSESVWHSNFSRLLYEHFHVASFKSLYRRLATRLDRQRWWCFWCMCAIKSVVFRAFSSLKLWSDGEGGRGKLFRFKQFQIFWQWKSFFSLFSFRFRAVLAKLHKDFFSANSFEALFCAYLSWNISMMIISRSFQVSHYFNVYCALSGLCIILALVATPSAQLAGSHSRRRLHDQLITAVMNNSLHFFQSTPFGRIINRFSFDMSIIDKVWFDGTAREIQGLGNKTHQSSIWHGLSLIWCESVVSENRHHQPTASAIYSPVLMCHFN